MLASYVLTSVLAVAALATPLGAKPSAPTPTGAAALESALATLSADTTKLNTTLNSFGDDESPGAAKSLIILNQAKAARTDLETAYNITTASSQFSQADSNTIASDVLAFEPVIFSVLNNLVAHKPAFTHAIGNLNVTPIIINNLKNLRASSAQFASALGSKLSANYQSAAPVVAKQIDDAFAKAIAAFQS